MPTHLKNGEETHGQVSVFPALQSEWKLNVVIFLDLMDTPRGHFQEYNMYATEGVGAFDV
jgi:hypothetical protein